MRIKLVSGVFLLLLTTYGFTQTPQKISFQTVIRDAAGHLLATQAEMNIQILQGSANGTIVYSETQTPTPNANGLVTIEIGGVNPLTFLAINWSAGPYYIKTETNPGGGEIVTEINQILSVPYALYAKTADGLSVGEFYGGGIIVAVARTSTGEHGLIASLTNLGPNPGSSWCDDIYMTTLIGPSAQSLTDGQANTNAIIAQSLDFACAAKLCDDYTNPETGTGVYSDWYLPSIKELEKCYTAKFAVTNILGILDGFLFDNYWSSTENSNDVPGEKTVYFIGFHIGILNPGGHKSHFLRVRAVRKF